MSMLRIFISEGDKQVGRPFYERIVLKAREQGLASLDLPIVVELVDSKEKPRFLTQIDEPIKEGLATLEKAEVYFYRSGSPA
jgi:PII-like signaling protein